MQVCPKCLEKGHKAEIFLATNMSRCLRCAGNVVGVEVKTPPPRPSFKRKGKMVICTIHGRKPLEEADINLLAVGKPKGYTYFDLGWKHEPGLAPSRELVTFTKEHNRKGHKDGWFERYTESLLDEWTTREDAKKALGRLVKWLKEGKTVAVACYCDSVKREFCHLSILRDIIEDMGFYVEEAIPIKYR
jgi:hypothetical protein